MTFETNGRSPLSYFEVPLGRDTTGPVMLTLNGRTTTGAEIRAGCDDSEVDVLAKRRHLEVDLTRLTLRYQDSLNAVAIHV